MAQRGQVQRIGGERGAGVHAYTVEELEGIVDHVNRALKKTTGLEDYLPINESNEDLFTVVSDGVVLS